MHIVQTKMPDLSLSIFYNLLLQTVSICVIIIMHTYTVQKYDPWGPATAGPLLFTPAHHRGLVLPITAQSYPARSWPR